MVYNKITIDKIQLNKNQLQFAVSIICDYEGELMSPKLRITFENNGATRFMPVPVSDFVIDDGKCIIKFENSFLLNKLFYNHNIFGDLFISLNMNYGSAECNNIVLSDNAVMSDEIKICDNKVIIKSLNIRYLYKNHEKNIRGIVKNSFSSFVEFLYKIFSLKKINNSKISFISCRRDDLSGNMKYVYDLIKDEKDVEFEFLLFSNPKDNYKFSNIIRFLRLYSTSKIVIVDDYFRLMNSVKKRQGVTLIQLWHACGAFKTFGYSRIGKFGGPSQTDCSHRMYDKAIVSSKNIIENYCEGFGLSRECVVPTGIPRTDLFFDSNYSSVVKNKFYEKYPMLKDKKIILFAPTFRGTGQMNAYYDLDKFNPAKLYEALGGKYAIIIKLHPFCKDKFAIDDKYRDYIIDLSDNDELNDLLFVTDLLITDYSSVVFEASLLEVPMVFYAYDLMDYISKRDFYYDYLSFVPGKIVYSQNELCDCIINNDFETEKIEQFKNEFFDSTDGLSSQRVVDLILECLRGEIV